MKKLLLSFFLALTMLLPLSSLTYAQGRYPYRYDYDYGYNYQYSQSDLEDSIAVFLLISFVFAPILLATYV